jgi:xylose isomerase
MELFKTIERIEYEGVDSNNPLAFVRQSLPIIW